MQELLYAHNAYGLLSKNEALLHNLLRNVWTELMIIEKTKGEPRLECRESPGIYIYFPHFFTVSVSPSMSSPRFQFSLRRRLGSHNSTAGGMFPRFTAA